MVGGKNDVVAVTSCISSRVLEYIDMLMYIYVMVLMKLINDCTFNYFIISSHH